MAQIKVWNGSANVNPKAINVWNGSAWVQKVGKRWTGSTWEDFISYLLEEVYVNSLRYSPTPAITQNRRYGYTNMNLILSKQVVYNSSIAYVFKDGDYASIDNNSITTPKTAIYDNQMNKVWEMNTRFEGVAYSEDYVYEAVEGTHTIRERNRKTGAIIRTITIPTTAQAPNTWLAPRGLWVSKDSSVMVYARGNTDYSDPDNSITNGGYSIFNIKTLTTIKTWGNTGGSERMIRNVLAPNGGTNHYGIQAYGQHYQKFISSTRNIIYSITSYNGWNMSAGNIAGFNNDMYIGFSSGGTGGPNRLGRYNATTGAQIRVVDVPASLGGPTVDEHGNVYMGYAPSHIRKYNSALDLIWTLNITDTTFNLTNAICNSSTSIID